MCIRIIIREKGAGFESPRVRRCDVGPGPGKMQAMQASFLLFREIFRTAPSALTCFHVSAISDLMVTSCCETELIAVQCLVGVSTETLARRRNQVNAAGQFAHDTSQATGCALVIFRSGTKLEWLMSPVMRTNFKPWHAPLASWLVSRYHNTYDTFKNMSELTRPGASAVQHSVTVF